jgi:hypothetical protein
MSIFDTIREFFGGQAEDLAQQATEQLPIEDVQNMAEQAGQVGEEAGQQAQEAAQNIQDKFQQ